MQITRHDEKKVYKLYFNDTRGKKNRKIYWLLINILLKM